MPSHTISVQVENEFGVLARVAGLFSSRGYNIESLTVNEDPLDPTLSRITLVTSGDEQVLEQINKQLNKLVSVIKVTDFKDIDAIDREMVLIKVAVDERNRSESARRDGLLAVLCTGLHRAPPFGSDSGAGCAEASFSLGARR